MCVITSMTHKVLFQIQHIRKETIPVKASYVCTDVFYPYMDV